MRQNRPGGKLHRCHCLAQQGNREDNSEKGIGGKKNLPSRRPELLGRGDVQY